LTPKDIKKLRSLLRKPHLIGYYDKDPDKSKSWTPLREAGYVEYVETTKSIRVADRPLRSDTNAGEVNWSWKSIPMHLFRITDTGKAALLASCENTTVTPREVHESYWACPACKAKYKAKGRPSGPVTCKTCGLTYKLAPEQAKTSRGKPVMDDGKEMVELRLYTNPTHWETAKRRAKKEGFKSAAIYLTHRMFRGF